MFDIFEVAPAIGILIACAILAIISKILQRKFVNKREMDYFKSQIKDYQKKMKELMKEDTEKSKKELDRMQTEMLEVNTKMLSSSMKMMWITMPVFLIAFGILSYLYSGMTIESLVPLPKFIGFNILWPPSWFSWLEAGFSTQAGFFKIYFFSYLAISIVLNLIETVYDKKIKKDIVEVKK